MDAATVDVTAADATKDLVDLETTLVSGLSYFFYSVAETMVLAEVDVAMAVAMTAAYGLSSSYFSVAATDSDSTTMVVDADAMITADATTAAANNLFLCDGKFPSHNLHIFPF